MWTAAGQLAAALLPLPDDPVEEDDDAGALDDDDSFAGESFVEVSFGDDEPSDEDFAASPEEEPERLSVR